MIVSTIRTLGIILLSLVFVAPLSAQQDEEAPFGEPQELAYSNLCFDTNDPVKCTLSQMESRIRPVLEKYVKKIKADTVKLSLHFRFDSDGKTIKQDIKLGDVKKSLSKKIMPELKEAISAFKFKTINYNGSLYPSTHTYDYKFLLDKNNISLTGMATENSYEGGSWGQIPLFPDCPRKGDEKDRQCFQENMQAHIKRHFRYPEAALRYGIQGKVDVSFVIGTKGEVTKLKMISTSDILKKEAARIVSLLPTFKPGIQNGKAVRVPYSIPIWFRLQ